MAQLWEVVGGNDLGGIFVREGQDTKSAQCAERLAIGSIVEEVELKDVRLKYKLVKGSGPEEGWVSVKLNENDLLVQTGAEKHTLIEVRRQSSPDYVTFKHAFTQDNPGRIEDFYKLEKKEVLGEGTFGHVHKGTHKHTGKICAIKVIHISRMRDAKAFESEVHIQQELDHPNIVKLYEVFHDAKKIYLVEELCTGGELFDRIVEEADKNDDGHAFDERRAASYMQQILHAVCYLHEKGYVHRDIKPENFLLANKSLDAPLKVIDFGLANKFASGVDNPMRTQGGTANYVAPEVLQGSYDEKCDIWSCGVIAYVLLCGYPPFDADRDADIFRLVRAGAFDFPSPDWDDISKEGKEIIKLMLTKEVAKRPSAAQLLKHPWLEAHAVKPVGSVPKSLIANLKKFNGGSKLKKVALTLIAQQVNEAEIEDLKNTFFLLDEHGRGTLSIPEMMDACKKHNPDTCDESLNETLQQLDTDGSGSIDYTEFIAATLSPSTYRRKDVLWGVFKSFDINGNGVISKPELRQMLSSLNFDHGTKLEDFIATVYKEVDLDGDGEISFEEFSKMMEI